MRTNTRLLPGLILAVLCLLMAATAVSDPFEYTYMGTIQWVPYASDNQVMDMSDRFGRTPDLITVYSASDFRMRAIQARYENQVGLTTTAVLDTSLSAAQLDTIFTAAKGSDGFGAVPVPAAGKNFYGTFFYLAFPAATDTIVVDAYKLWR